jgi:hypothetical protein
MMAIMIKTDLHTRPDRAKKSACLPKDRHVNKHHVVLVRNTVMILVLLLNSKSNAKIAPYFTW